MARQESDRVTEQKDGLFQIYQDRESVTAILKKLDYRWKSGDNISADLDKLLNRYDALMVFFEYLVRKNLEWERGIETERISFLEKLEVLGTEQAEFLDDLANQCRSLEKPFRNYILSKRGTINHLSRISVEGVYYNPDIQTVQAGFSLYTFDTQVLQTKDDIDDFIWLSEGILDVVIKALQECRDKNSPLSQEYAGILQARFKSLNEKHSIFQELIENLDSPSEFSLNLSDEMPVVDLSDE